MHCLPGGGEKSVLECRVYLDNPVDLNSWLLSPRYNILPRIFAAIKPLVLPKLQEEAERAKTRGKKVAAVKDVVVEGLPLWSTPRSREEKPNRGVLLADDFEVSLFLTNSGTRHTVMTKQKTLRIAPPRLLSNSSRLTGGHDSARVEIREESHDSPGIDLDDIPAALTPVFVVPDTKDGTRGGSRGKNTRGKSKKRKSPAPAAQDGGCGDSGSEDSDPYAPPLKRQKTPVITIPDGDADSFFDHDLGAEHDDKKKLGLETAYEGFNIYSSILCIVVKRHGTIGRRAGTTTAAAAVARGKVMEEWISMSQAIKDGDAE